MLTCTAREIVDLIGYDIVAGRSVAAPYLGAGAQGAGPEADEGAGPEADESDGVDDWTIAASLMSLSQV